MFRSHAVAGTGLLLLLVFMAAACGGDATAEPTNAPEIAAPVGDPERGRDIWATGGGVVGEPGCSYCHSIDGSEQTDDVVVLAPSWLGISDQAGGRVPGMSAEEYLRESMLSPSAFIVDGFAFLMTL
jgi:hypothetical protein